MVLAVVGVVVVVIIIVVVVLMRGTGGPAAPGGTGPGGTANNGTSGQTGGTPMTLKDLLTAGISRQCAFSTQNPSNALVTGTVYVTSGHLRGDFNSKNASGTLTSSHIITDGQTAYVWTDSPAQGFQMSFASMSSPAAGNKGFVNPDQSTNYSCTSWSADQTEFTPPANIKFTDMSAMMGGAGAPAGATGSGAGMSATCAMCAQAGSPQGIAACKAALHCQ